MIDLDAASVLLQWATGGLFFLWVTGRRREVGIGYGWTMRATFGLMAVGGVVVGLVLDPVPVREGAGIGMAASVLVATVVSVLRRRAGVSGQRDEEERPLHGARKEGRVDLAAHLALGGRPCRARVP